jgi:hypothetical protein
VENKENIDQLFKDGLLEPDIPFDEENWEKMSRKLDFQARKRLVPMWLIWGSAVAAALVIVLFWMFSKPDLTDYKHPKNQIAKQHQSGAGNATQNKDIKTHAEGQKPVDKRLAHRNQAQIAGNNRSGDRIAYAAKKVEGQPIMAGSKGVTDSSVLQHLEMLDERQLALNAGTQAAAQQTSVPFSATINTDIPMSKRPSESYAAVAKDVKKKMETGSGKKSSFTLSAMLAPDISYAKSSIPSKVSSNVGLLATYGFSTKLSVTTGAIYSNKYYNSNVNGVNAYNLSGASYQVKASCNVLDIPLNVNYKVVDKKVYSLSVNTGLSSYLMLKEKYDYIYPQVGSNPNIVSYQVSNQNKHILGVANVAITVERKIASNLSIGVQPFMKLPLTGIGAGDASLKSSGLSFSINMGLFPAKKPGKYAGLRHY